MRYFFPIFDLKNGVTLKSGSEVTQCDTILYIEHDFLLAFFSNFVIIAHCFFVEIFDFKNAVTLKTGLGVRQGHGKCHHLIERIAYMSAY